MAHIRSRIRISHRLPGFGLALPIQCGLFLAAIAGIALSPPQTGAMLLIPTHAGASATIDLALDRGARLLGTGPLPGSVVVRGDRAAILPAMLEHGTLVTAALPMICGDIAAAQEPRA